MKLKFWRKTPPAPTRPGGSQGFRLGPEPGTVIVHYRGCEHESKYPSTIKFPYMCPNPEHTGWEWPDERSEKS